MKTVAVISVLVFLALVTLGVLFLIKVLREQSPKHTSTNQSHNK